MVATVSLAGIEKHFGGQRTLKGVSLDVEAGEFLTLVGPSGCGKSSLLRIIAGLMPQDRGSISIGGAAVDHLPPKARDVSMVFQSYALYPHMSVFDNIATPLRVRRLPPLARLPWVGRWMPGQAEALRDIAHEVGQVAAQVEINSLLDRRPAQLSGGQRQRVALARAMVRHPSVFLMDEPLSNLDARLRVHMRGELSSLHRRLGATFIYVTHDQVEAMTMSTRVAVMMDGEIVQVAPPHELYANPSDVRVARFIGSPEINLFPAEATPDGRILCGGRSIPLKVDARGPVTLAVRPEMLRLGVGATDLVIGARLQRIENLGHDALLHVEHGLREPSHQSASPASAVLRLPRAELESLRALHRLDGEFVIAAHARDVLVFGSDGKRVAVKHADMTAGNEAGGVTPALREAA